MESKRAGTANRLRCKVRACRLESGQDGVEQLLQKRYSSVGLLRPEGNAHFGEC